jgi:diguanylate cyclase (GGDEF)-like protein
MKIDRVNVLRGVRAVGVAAYARQPEALTVVEGPTPGTGANVMGIPENEFTPRVRDAIMALMSEVEALQRELQQTRARLDEAEKAADQDHLLPVFNRRAFVRELTRHSGFAQRYGMPASLIYFDLDGFKQVNDTYGHAGGDAVLAHFAQVMLSNVRSGDVVGRLGGDEFGIILSHADQNQAHRKADLLATKLNDRPTVWEGHMIPVSFSYGAFQLQPGEDAAVAMTRADEAMYAQKRAR